ncbi:hypothetical protein G6F37_007380 [Rhizopus arrhizus]|nr:hypothetical protein G6F38_007485 [Rhizopus arrhizus]KAG1156686.1 hypothetical protein G6F37_007380 [Rhizopus arrhizus]
MGSDTLDQPIFAIGTIIEDLEIIQTLSISVNGQVYLAKDINTFQLYAIKSLHHIDSASLHQNFQLNEILLHSRLSGHPHVIRIERVIQNSDWTHIVIEYGSEGDLFTAIVDNNIYYGNHSLIRHVFLQLIETVRFCHSKGIYHRDLKPENILVFDRGHTLKLADFGLATADCYSKDYGCGSTFYFSPECQGGFLIDSQMGYATAPNDVWSLGVILINLSTGRNPWHIASLEDKTYCAFLRDPDLLLKMLPISSELNRIIKRIFCLDPLKRITLDELYLRVQHCIHFTRTEEVTQYESMVLKAVQLKNAQVYSKSTDDLPTPPDTPDITYSPCIDQGSSSSFMGTGLLQKVALFPKMEKEI